MIENGIRVAATIGAGIVAIFLIYSIVKDGVGYARGGSGITGIIGKVMFLMLVMGVVVIGANYKDFNKHYSTALDDPAVIAVETTHTTKAPTKAPTKPPTPTPVPVADMWDKAFHEEWEFYFKKPNGKLQKISPQYVDYKNYDHVDFDHEKKVVICYND